MHHDAQKACQNPVARDEGFRQAMIFSGSITRFPLLIPVVFFAAIQGVDALVPV